MAFYFLAAEMLLILAITTFLLHKYGDWKRQHVLVSAATLVSWYFSFSIVAILPIDVVQTIYEQCIQNESKATTAAPAPMLDKTSQTTLAPTSLKNSTSTAVPNSSSSSSSYSSCQEPYTDVPDEVLRAMWLVVYWSSFALTWLILPFMQAYSMAGEFTVLSKVKRSLIDNAIFYASYLVILLALSIYLLVKGAFKLNKESIKTLITTASNTWGLFFMVLLMGYGLVEVPRYIWNMSRREHRLRRTYFQIAKLHAEKSDAAEALEDILDEIKDAHAQIRPGSEYYSQLSVIISKSPTNFQDRLLNRPGGGIGRSGEYSSLSKLISLHKRLLVARQNLWRLEAKWEALLKKAFKLEDIAKSKNSGTKEYRRYSRGEGVKNRSSICSPRLEFYWRCYMVPRLLQVGGVVLAFLSVTLLWSEITFFQYSPTLSVYALLVHIFTNNSEYFTIQTLCVFVICYMCVTVYWTVFRVRFFNFYYLSPHHHTDEYTLLFSGTLLCRLTPAICLNFLGLTHMDSHISRDKDQVPTQFTNVMGHFDIVGFISDGFNIYFPLVMIFLCLMTFFNVGSHLLSFIGFQQFMDEGELTSELVDEGQHSSRGHKRIERENKGEQRRREWDERLNRSGRETGGGPGEGGTGEVRPAYKSRSEFTEQMRAKYSRTNPNRPAGAGDYSTNASSVGQSRGAYSDNVSDNSATDLLDDDYVDFQDYRREEIDKERNARDSSSFSKYNKPAATIFDDI